MAESKNVFAVGSRVSIYKFKPEEIKVDAHLNGRHELPDIAWLVKDILERGQLEPVIVRKDGERPALVAGFSRWRAVIQINKEKLMPAPLEILATYFRGNERDGFIANIRENRFRNSTSLLDDGHNLAKMMAWNMDEKQIEAIYFPDSNGDQVAIKKHIAWIRKTVKLANLAPEIEEAVKEGRVKPSAVAHIAEMATEAQKALAEKSGNITSKDVSQAEGKPAKLNLKAALRKAANAREYPGGRLPVEICDWILELLTKA